MRDERNPERQNQSNQQQRQDRVIDRLEFGSDFIDNLPDHPERTERTVTRDWSIDRANKRIK